jgi:hypothetical protein
VEDVVVMTPEDVFYLLDLSIFLLLVSYLLAGVHVHQVKAFKLIHIVIDQHETNSL